MAMFLRSFSTHVRRHTVRSTAIAGVCMLVGCTSSIPPIQRLKDGSYRLECRDTLANCLAQAEKPCAAYGYEVLSGRQETRVYGPEQVQSTFVNSQAIVMCRNAEGLFDGDPQPARAAKARELPRLVRPAHACVPGASQSCTGRAGCQGGQTCALDGSAYLPCDCGETAEPPKPPDAVAAPAPSASELSSVPAATTAQPANPVAPEPAKSTH